MSPPQPERIYGVRELTRILTLTPKRAGQLRRLDLLRGDSGYTFRDLLALRAASALLDAGASVRQIRTALTALRRQDPELKQPLAEVRLVLEGDRLVAQSDRVRFDPRTGQMVLALDWGGLEAAATATLATGLVRPLAPPVDQAETWFERASEWDGDPAQWEDAIDAYRRVVSIDPTYAAAWNNLGLLLHRMGRYDEAGTAYLSALDHDPQCCEAAYNLGSLHEDRGEIEDAIGDYRKALDLSPDYADAHFNLAGALARNGRDGEAIKHWQRYLERDSGSPWARLPRAAPDVAGLGDRLAEAGLTAFGPSAGAAAIEGSKAFSKDLMRRYGLPTARFATFDEPAGARRFCRELGAPLVVKADGLAAGKGAIVCATLEDADAAIAECMERRAFGAAGARVVVEEFMVGQEVSFFVLSNGGDVMAVAAAGGDR